MVTMARREFIPSFCRNVGFLHGNDRYLNRNHYTESQSGEGVGRALCGPPSPTPCPSRVTHSRLHSTASGGAGTSPEKETPQPLLSAQLSSLSRSRWMAAQPAGVSTTPPSLVSSANLLRVHSNSSSRSLMKKLNYCGGFSFLEKCWRPAGDDSVILVLT